MQRAFLLQNPNLLEGSGHTALNIARGEMLNTKISVDNYLWAPFDFIAAMEGLARARVSTEASTCSCRCSPRTYFTAFTS